MFLQQNQIIGYNFFNKFFLRLGSVAWGVWCNGVRVGSILHGGDELAPSILAAYYVLYW